MLAAKVGTLAFPFLGPGVALFDLLTSPIRGKRMDDWCEELRQGLNDLSRKMAELTPKRLAADEAFISAFAQATQAALKTHQQEKLEALRNAVLNVAVGQESDDRQTNFIALVDRFTPAHLKVLQKFHQPPVHGGYTQWRMRQTSTQPADSALWIKEFVPGLADEDLDFLRMLVGDLYNAGLSQVKPTDSYIPSEMTWTTAFGTAFLRFIAPPQVTER